MKNLIINLSNNFLIKILTFGIALFIARYFGSNELTDTYFTAATIPLWLFTVITYALNSAYIPVYQKIITERGQNDANAFFNTFLVIGAIIIVIIGIITWFIIPIIFSLLLIGFTKYELNNTISILKIFIFAFVIEFIVNILSTIFILNKKFIYLGLVNNALPFTVILSVIFLHKSYTIFSLPYGYLWGTILQLLIAVFLIGKSKIYLIGSFKFVKEDFVQITKLLFASLLGLISYPIFALGIRGLASRLQEGSISAIDYTEKLMSQIPYAIATAFAISIYPDITKYWAEKDNSNFDSVIIRNIRMLVFLLTPIAIFIGFNSIEVTKLFFMRGSFTIENVIVVANLIKIYSLKFICVFYEVIFSFALFASQNVIKSVIASVAGLIFGLAASYLLLNALKLEGIALGLNLGFLVQAILTSFFYYGISSKKKDIRKIIYYNAKMLVISGILIFITKFIFLVTFKITYIIPIFFVFFAFYFMIGFYLKEPILLRIIKSFKNKLFSISFTQN